MTMPLLGFIAVALLAMGLVAPFFAAAFAEPLDQAACVSLQAERKKLLTPKMQAALEQGPDWVKDHLNDEDIEKVREFLLVEEKLEFRCRGSNVVAKALREAAANPDRVTLPDRKPAVPQTAAANADPAPSRDPEMPMPDRKPGAAQSAAANVQASQAVADSAKTAPSKAKATR